MTLFHRNICTKPLQKFAFVHNLFYAKKRATNALATHQWPLTQPTIGVSIMPSIPITAISVFLQGGAL